MTEYCSYHTQGKKGASEKLCLLTYLNRVKTMDRRRQTFNSLQLNDLMKLFWKVGGDRRQN